MSPALTALPACSSTGWPWTEETPFGGGRDLPLISVVMPSLNQAKWLEAAIRSVLLQGYCNYQLVVMDGGSTDGSVDMLRRYEKWLAWSSGPDEGQYAAINEGFRRSIGDIMGWLNSSDMLVPGAFQAIGAAFSERKVRWLTTGMPGQWDEAGQLLFPTQTRRRYRLSWIEKGWYEGRVLGWVQQESTYWARDLWEQAGGVDDSLQYAGDFDLWRKFARLAPLHTIDVPLGGFRPHDDRKSEDLTPYYAEVDRTRAPVPWWLRKRAGTLGKLQRRALTHYGRLVGHA